MWMEPTSEQLMVEMDWVRRLARALLRDDAAADDVAQETWLIAASEQPDEDRPLRPWLARVVRNLSRTRRRGEARRDEREAAYEDTSDRVVATPAELVERVELQRVVAGEVLALAEPFRSTILLHFFEGLSSAQIARRLGIPNGTVRRRLKTALDQLRDALRNRTDQPKGGWLAALVPLAKLPGPTPASTAMGVVAMKKLIGVIVALVLLLLVGAGALWRYHSRSDGSANSGTSGAGQQRTRSQSGLTLATTIPDEFTQPGTLPRRIAGHVVFHGASIGGATVRLGLDLGGEPMSVLVMPDSGPKLLQPVAEVTSAPDGSFDFGVQPGAAFTVSASTPDQAGASVAVANFDPRSRSDQLVVELGDCGSRMSGMIADASGGGVPKARISFAGLSGMESDATGKYSLCLSTRDALGTPSAQVRVEADGYGTTSETVIVVGDLHHDFLLVPEAVLVGRVTTSDGAPVAGARVIASGQPTEIKHHLASRWGDSDPDGRFRIVGLAPGGFQLMVSVKGLGATSLAVVARPTKTSREIHLVLKREPRARVRGLVLMKGTPASGVFVSAVQGGRPVGGGLSQADGHFVLDGIPYGATKFFASPNQPEALKEVEVKRPLVDDVRIDITHAATVRVHVVRQGKPVVGADVMYMPAPQATFFGPPAAGKTDASGVVMLDLPVGVGQLVVWDFPSKAFANPQPVEVTSNEDKTVEIELDFSGEVQGTVVNQDGAAVAGAYVRMDLADGSGDMCESMTNAGGQFDCTMLTGGEYRATVAPSPGVRHGFAPAVGDHFDTIHVPRVGVVAGVQLAIKDERLAIHGTVVDDTGATMPDVYIEATVPGAGEWTMGPAATLSDANGQFAIGNLARGTYALSAHAADGSEGAVPDVAAGNGSVSIKVARAGAIDGTLTGFSDTPVVFVMSTTPNRFGARAAVEGTSFSQIGVPPGRYTVNAMAGAEADGQSIEVQPGETAHVDLHSRGVGTVEGTVSEFAAHTPMAGMRCEGRISMGGQMGPAPPDVTQQAFTDAAGHFVVNAPLGRVRLLCFSPSPAPLSLAGTDVDVTSGTRPKVSVFSVRATLGGPPGDVGFSITPDLLPIAVSQVVPNGPAAVAGLHAGDQLVAIDGASLQGLLPDGAMFLLANHRPGSTVTLGVSRGGTAQTIKVPVPR
jgi:RNA polymerase sigma factor (sigma-70 family)